MVSAKFVISAQGASQYCLKCSTETMAEMVSACLTSASLNPIARDCHCTSTTPSLMRLTLTTVAGPRQPEMSLFGGARQMSTRSPSCKFRTSPDGRVLD